MTRRYVTVDVVGDASSAPRQAGSHAGGAQRPGRDRGSSPCSRAPLTLASRALSR
jgi:hypothetical protein